MILVVLIGGFGFLAVRRQWIERQDDAMNEVAEYGWRTRSDLPHDAGPPYHDYSPDLFLMMPSDIMEGTEEGFEVSYFTVRDRAGNRAGGGPQHPASIVQVAVETPKFRYVAQDLAEGASGLLTSLRHQTPPHYEGGTPGRVGPKTAEVLSLTRSVSVQTAPFSIFIRSHGASPEAVARLTMALAKAIVADATPTA